MQTVNIENQKAESIIRKCVHCGFCLATCPTYNLLGNELDSPRGRIYLIKSALEKNEFTQNTIHHLDKCLTCRSCETTCPSGVEYGELIDIGRNLVESKRSVFLKFKRDSLRWFLTNRKLFPLFGRLFRHSSIKTPKLSPNKKSQKILLLSGCVQPTLAPNINHSVKNVLIKLGYNPVERINGECCGALDQHLSANETALTKVKRNIDNWLIEGIDTIISAASGCGVMVKDYPKLFDKNDPYYSKAEEISNKTKDIAEFLVNEDLSQLSTPKVKLNYHAPCTLQHGQQLPGIVESILIKLGYDLPDVPDAHMCCGSAGTYSTLQPKISKHLRNEKLKNLDDDQFELILTSNIGCLLHLQNGTKTPVKHWIEIFE